MKRIAALLFLSLALPAHAEDAQVVGTSVLGGKRVELLNDNTWRFAEFGDDEDAGCVPVNQVLSFCGTIFDWRPVDTTGTEFLRQFQHDSRTHAGILYEEVGAADGMDMEFMRNAVIENAAMGTGVRPEEIPVHGAETRTVDGHPAETVIYGANFNGLDIVYINTIVNSDHHNLQFVIWTVGKAVTDKGRAASEGFLKSMRITFPEAAQ